MITFFPLFLQGRCVMSQVPKDPISEKESAAFGYGIGFGLVAGIVVASFFWFLWSVDVNAEIRSLKSSAVEYGYASWVTGKNGDPIFQWKVPVEKSK
jgi:hypothetical protein